MLDGRQQNSDWERLEEALKKSQSLAAAGQFAAAIMHEINNPLEAISNLNYLINVEPDNPENVRVYSRLLEEQLGLVIEIAHQTLSFCRPPDALTTVDLGALAQAAIRIHEGKAAAKNVRIERKIARINQIHSHAGELLQVVANLIGNALDAMSEGGTLHVRVRKAGTDVHITVADNGHGIPSEMLTRIFEPFFSTKKERGTGLGLAISKSILERHGGRARVRSSVQEGKSGTAFRLSFPQQDY